MKRKRVKMAAMAVVVIFLGFLFADALGVFDSSHYRVIPHGNHNHYVPVDRDMSVPLDAFPTQRPAEGERITPWGEVVRE